MKRILASIFAAAALYGCGASDYTVTGRNHLMPGDSIFLFGSDRKLLASGTVAQDTTFSLRGSVRTPDIASLGDRECLRRTLLMLEPGVIRCAPCAQGCIVTGTPLNDSIRALNDCLAALREEYVRMTPETSREQIEAVRERVDRIPREMMEHNLDNILGVYLFTSHVFPQSLGDSIRLAAAKTAMEAFPSRLQTHPLLHAAREKLTASENTRTGMPYTELALPDTAGSTVTLSSRLEQGHWILLEFWASWSPACTREIPALKRVYEAYEEKGFDIYSVSLDNDVSRWRKIVEENHLPWTNVLGIDENKQSDAASRYCVTALPANFLISPQRMIAAKNLNAEALRRKLDETIR